MERERGRGRERETEREREAHGPCSLRDLCAQIKANANMATRRYTAATDVCAHRRSHMHAQTDMKRQRPHAPMWPWACRDVTRVQTLHREMYAHGEKPTYTHLNHIPV
jgi:hypothetical protein